jgi:NTP pyrophosphatase (non-canonical NTP hydrolase)
MNQKMTIRQWQKAVHDNAKVHGWWETQRPVPELLCLIHSEVSEALEAYRKEDEANFREELADVAIRLLDMCEGFDIDLDDEIMRKHLVNLRRSYRHGGKRC